MDMETRKGQVDRSQEVPEPGEGVKNEKEIDNSAKKRGRGKKGLRKALTSVEPLCQRRRVKDKDKLRSRPEKAKPGRAVRPEVQTSAKGAKKELGIKEGIKAVKKPGS